MRTITQIFWHCADTPEGRDDKFEDVKRWHVEGNGWSDIGYHFVIELSGRVVPGRPLERTGAGIKGYNGHSIHICYIGGRGPRGGAKDTRTPEQRAALYKLTADLLEKFPGAAVLGHRDVANKSCPSFDAAKDWASYALNEPSTEREPCNALDCPHCGQPVRLERAG